MYIYVTYRYIHVMYVHGRDSLRLVRLLPGAPPSAPTRYVHLHKILD